MVYDWILSEEWSNYATIKDLVEGTPLRYAGFYPLLQHYLIYYLYLVSGVSAKVISQMSNPFLIALTIFPIYGVLRKNYSSSRSLWVTALWVFSESVLYRTASFATTEVLGLLLLWIMFYFYIHRFYFGAILSLIIMPFAHLLPFAYGVAMVSGDQFLHGNPRQRKLAVILMGVFIVYIYSPINTHLRLTSVLNPLVILSKFKLSNIGIYSVSELMFGAKIFAGTFFLILFTIIHLVMYEKKERFYFTQLIITVGLIIWSWMGYSTHIFAPPRLTIYLIIPCAVYATKLLNKNSLSLLCVLMVVSSYLGVSTMLYINDALTREEAVAINDLKMMGILDKPVIWWTDYTARNYLLMEGIYIIEPVEVVNETQIAEKSVQLLDPYTTTGHDSIFDYVFLSKRMEKNAFYILTNGTRSVQVHKPVKDIWEDNPFWTKIYEKNGVKVYER